MPPRMDQCIDCGKLFAPAPDKTLCDTCIRNRMSQTERVREAVEKQGLESPQDIAIEIGIPMDEVSAILGRLELPHKEVSAEALCTRCKRKESMQGSPFCGECRSALDQQFGEAARILEEKIAMKQSEQPVSTTGSRMSTREALEKKRLRKTDQGHGGFRR